MKNNIQRIIVMVAVVALSVSFLVFPASAAYDYNDLITNIEVDGDNDIVTISIPEEAIRISLEYPSGYTTAVPSTLSLNASLIADHGYSLYVAAFRYVSYLDVTNIPDETLVTFNYTISSSSTGANWIRPSEYTQIRYFANGSFIGKDTVKHNTGAGVQPGPFSGSFSYDMVMHKPDGAQEAFFRFALQDFSCYETTDFNFSVDSFTLTFSISSLYRLQEQTGKQNEILKAVEKKLEENGQKLDDIINGTPEQNEQIDNAVGEMQGAVDRLEQVGDAMNSIERPDMSDIDISVDSLVPPTSLLAYTGPILSFWENDTLLAMVTIVCTLILVSWVFFGKKG